MRVVLDSNVLVSALISGSGPSALIFNAVRQQRIVWVYSTYIIDEVVHTMSLPRIQKKYNISPFVIQMQAKILNAVSVKILNAVIVEGICRDPADDPILACARDGRADYLITGDKDLLCLVQYVGIAIVTPKDYLEILEKHVPSRNC